MGNECVLGFSGPGRHDRSPACRLRQADGIEGFTDRANLVQLDQHRIGRPGGNALPDPAGISRE
ncbi:MAG: hypothetical protein R3F31_02635 [Verrucomicrobiales bacterium]